MSLFCLSNESDFPLCDQTYRGAKKWPITEEVKTVNIQMYQIMKAYTGLTRGICEASQHLVYAS